MSFVAVACPVPRTSMLLTGFNLISSDVNRVSLSVFPACVSSRSVKSLVRLAAVSSDDVPDPESKNQTRSRRKNQEFTPSSETENDKFPTKVPRKSKRGRRSEADAVEDFVRSSLERTFSTIREQNPEVFENKEKVNFIKDRGVDDEEEEGGGGGEMVVEEEDPDWPVDTDVGWGIKASEYFDTHPIKNVVGEDGTVIDWEGEIDDSWVKEINCLEWESFAFHPSPLVVLVFERYKRASDNWKTLKELEKAIKVYWNAKDRLPPRAVKIDLNIETDLAYALQAKECPQILFLRGNRILYREKDYRTADELVHMIAHFYYKAKRPSWIDKAKVTPFC
ncbi:Thioredoxin-like fold domain-containing protein MRL7 [Cardamine amara subsp. amara]|uniref:Thioredoxin-like fold domain-containing protein MRL7 n=1 Tax=Cardamine amara subsp. amara TaxID=228776 RepID=A0ABD1AIX3_CARAN